MGELLTSVPNNSIKLPYEEPVLTRHQRLQKVTLGTLTPRGIPYQTWADNNPKQLAKINQQVASEGLRWKLMPGESVSSTTYGTFGSPANSATVQIHNSLTGKSYTVPLSSRTE